MAKKLLSSELRSGIGQQMVKINLNNSSYIVYSKMQITLFKYIYVCVCVLKKKSFEEKTDSNLGSSWNPFKLHQVSTLLLHGILTLIMHSLLLASTTFFFLKHTQSFFIFGVSALKAEFCLKWSNKKECGFYPYLSRVWRACRHCLSVFGKKNLMWEYSFWF